MPVSTGDASRPPAANGASTPLRIPASAVSVENMGGAPAGLGAVSPRGGAGGEAGGMAWVASGAGRLARSDPSPAAPSFLAPPFAAAEQAVGVAVPQASALGESSMEDLGTGASLPQGKPHEERVAEEPPAVAARADEDQGRDPGRPFVGVIGERGGNPWWLLAAAAALVGTVVVGSGLLRSGRDARTATGAHREGTPDRATRTPSPALESHVSPALVGPTQSRSDGRVGGTPLGGSGDAPASDTFPRASTTTAVSDPASRQDSSWEEPSPASSPAPAPASPEQPTLPTPTTKGRALAVAASAAEAAPLLPERVVLEETPEEPLPSGPKSLPSQVGASRLAINPSSGRYRVTLPRTIDNVRATVRVCVSSEGRVTNVTVLRSSEPSVNPRIQSVLGRWRYRPWLEDGDPVPFCYAFQYETVQR